MIIKAHTAYDPVRDALHGKFTLHGVGLGIHAVEHRKVGVGTALLSHDLLYPVCNVLRLFTFVVHLIDVYTLPVPRIRPQRLVLSGAVVLDDGVCGGEYVLSGAVVLLQPYHMAVGKFRFKVQDILYSGSPETVYGLVIIAYHAQVPRACRKEGHKAVLGVVGVLILVNGYVSEKVLIVSEHIGIGLEELHRLHYNVVEVDGIGGCEPLLILGVYVGYAFEPIVVPCL